uniref:Uncharacterized protein n=1 Tax=Siphoviridae sp. ct1NJ1 TaxID=2827557 RepID=A0A8S5RRF6_9CAUD|nr:MAG TPA: hypothetical protein [Siphoviridae sp. ct1NJ1]DAX22021.1 MAG TPA: hypothetical protein [Caudoviricetes sp.]
MKGNNFPFFSLTKKPRYFTICLHLLGANLVI